MKFLPRAILTLSTATLCASAAADLRPFAFVKDSYPEGKGEIEYEQYVTWKGHKDNDHSFSRFEFTHEFEFGVADNFDFSIKLDWSHQHSDEGTRTHFDDVGFEGIIYFTNPSVDSFGSGLYLEATVGEDSLSFEGKLLLQKDYKQWTFAYNLAAETVVDGVFKSNSDNEVEGELANLFGVSYAVNQHFRVGGECVIESVFADWSDYEDTAVYLGPTLAYGSGDLNIIFTPLFQIGDAEGEPDFQFRLLATYEF